MDDEYIAGNAEPQLRHNANASTAAELGLRAPGLRAPEWYSRGYLPHRDRIGLLQAITFRLADSLPQEKLRELRELKERRERSTVAELGLRGPRGSSLGSADTAEERRKIEAWLDAGMGCCALRHPEMAKVFEETLLEFDDQKYKLIAWCIMPNHVHVLIEPMIELKRIVQSWKSFTGRWALTHNAELGLRVPGAAFWMPDYWDRFIRNAEHLRNTIDYIHHNPVRAGLCSTPEHWRWSSAPLKRGVYHD